MGTKYSKEQKTCLDQYLPIIKEACMNPSTFNSNFKKVSNALNRGERNVAKISIDVIKEMCKDLKVPPKSRFYVLLVQSALIQFLKELVDTRNQKILPYLPVKFFSRLKKWALFRSSDPSMDRGRYFYKEIFGKTNDGILQIIQIQLGHSTFFIYSSK